MQKIIERDISKKDSYIVTGRSLDENLLSRILMGEVVHHVQPNSGTVEGFRTATDGMKQIDCINVIINVNNKVNLNLYVKMSVPIYTVSHKSYSFLRNAYKADHVYINTAGKVILIKIVIDVNVDNRIIELWEIKHNFKPVTFSKPFDANIYANGLSMMGYLPSITSTSCGCALLGDTHIGDTIVQPTLDGLYGISSKELYDYIVDHCDTPLTHDMAKFISYN